MDLPPPPLFFFLCPFPSLFFNSQFQGIMSSPRLAFTYVERITPG